MSIKRGLARVEFIACFPEIQFMLEKGYTIKNIYDEFIKLKKISMSYDSFARYIRAKQKNIDESRIEVKTANIEQPAKTQDKKHEKKKPHTEAKPQEKPSVPKIKEKKDESIESIQFESYKDFI